MTSWIEIPAAQLHTFWPVENIGMVNRTGVTSLEQCKTICEGLSDCFFINWSEPHKICLTYQANETLQDTVETWVGPPNRFDLSAYPNKLLSYEFRDPNWLEKYPENLTLPDLVGKKWSILEDAEKSKTLKTHMRGNPIANTSNHNYISVDYGFRQLQPGANYYGPGNVNFGRYGFYNTPGCFDLQTIVNACDNDSVWDFSYCQLIDHAVRSDQDQCGGGVIARTNGLGGQGQTYYWYPNQNTTASQFQQLNSSNYVTDSRQILLRGTLKNKTPSLSNQQKVVVITVIALAVIAISLFSLSSKILRY